MIQVVLTHTGEEIDQVADMMRGIQEVGDTGQGQGHTLVRGEGTIGDLPTMTGETIVRGAQGVGIMKTLAIDIRDL